MSRARSWVSGGLFWTAWIFGIHCGSVAFAETRYAKSEVRVSVIRSSSTVGVSKRKLALGRPALQVDRIRAFQATTAMLNMAAIKKLKQLISITENSDPNKPDYIFRLAELCRERGRFFEHKARALDEAIYRATRRTATP